jgi:hypothetical protein
MRYTKPQITILTSAVSAIRSTSANKGSIATDNADGTQHPTATNTAYEADE